MEVAFGAAAGHIAPGFVPGEPEQFREPFQHLHFEPSCAEPIAAGQERIAHVIDGMAKESEQGRVIEIFGEGIAQLKTGFAFQQIEQVIELPLIPRGKVWLQNRVFGGGIRIQGYTPGCW